MKCPHCNSGVSEADARCANCGIDLQSPKARRLAEISTSVTRLEAEGRSLAAELRNEAIAYFAAQAAPARPLPQADAVPQFVPDSMGETKATSVRDLLLWLGAALCSIAALLFVAVAWDRLGLGGRVAIMATVTVLTAIGAHVVYRRGLKATGEALMTTALVFALIDVGAAHSLDLAGLGSVVAWLYWSSALVALAALFGAYTRVVLMRGPSTFALFAFQLAVLIALGGNESRLAFYGWIGILSVEYLALLALLPRFRARPSDSHLYVLGLISVMAAGSIVTLSTVLPAVITGIGEMSDFPDIAVGLAMLVLAYAAAPIVYGAGASTVRLGRTAAVILAAVDVFSGIVYTFGGDVQLIGCAVAGLICALVARPAERLLPRVFNALAVAFVTVALLGHIGDVLSAVFGYLTRLADPWESGSHSIRNTPIGEWVGDWTLLITLALSALTVFAWKRRSSVLPVGYLATAGLIATPLVAGLALQPTVALFGVVSVGLLIAASKVSDKAPALLARTSGAALLVLAITTSMTDELTSLVALGLGAVALALIASRDRAVAAAAWAGSALLANAFVPALVLSVTDDGYLFAIALVAFGLASAIAADRFRPTDKMLGFVVIGITAAIGGLLGVCGDNEWLSLGLLIAGSLIAVASLRKTRRRLGWVSASFFLLLLWLRLGMAGVETIEAYTLPFAGLSLLAGYMASRGERKHSSWTVYTAGLLVGFVPTMFLLEDDQTRALAFGLAALATLLFGASRRLQAPLVIGAVALSIDALVQLIPVASQLPRWIVVGAIGVLLVALGATYERRLRELRALRSRYDALG